jgi:enterochelin esterase-like enzyme
MSDLRLQTARLSDPRFTPETLLYFTIDAASLGGRGDVVVFVPPGPRAARDLPLLVLMHGAYGSAWHWVLRGGAHLVAQDLIARGEVPPLAIAMPSDGLRGASTGYLPQPDADYETWIVRDVVEACRALVPGVGAGSRLFLSGYSMGGFAALRLGAKYADRVSGVSAHCSVTHLDQLPPFLAPGSRGVRPLDPEDADVLTWLRRHRARLPPLRFDCGREDTLLEPNRRLASALAAEGIPHVFEEFDGAHDFAYYSAHLPDTLRFVARALSGPPARAGAPEGPP